MSLARSLLFSFSHFARISSPMSFYFIFSIKLPNSSAFDLMSYIFSRICFPVSFFFYARALSCFFDFSFWSILKCFSKFSISDFNNLSYFLLSSSFFFNSAYFFDVTRFPYASSLIPYYSPICTSLSYLSLISLWLSSCSSLITSSPLIFFWTSYIFPCI